MITGVYIGPRGDLKGRRALLQECKMHSGKETWKAQFNDLDLGIHHTHTWNVYPLNCFQVESRNNLDFNVGGIA